MNFLVIRSSDLIFAKILPAHPLRPYLVSQLALTTKKSHFQVENRPRAFHEFFGDLEFRPHFYQKFTLTPVKTSPMDPVGLHIQNGPFSSKLACTAKTAHIHCQTRPKADLTYVASWPSRLKRLIFKVKQAQSSYGVCWPTWPKQPIFKVKRDLEQGVNWPARLKRPIFKVKRYLEQVKPLFCRFSCAIVHGFFGDLEFRPHFCQNFTWTSIKTLPMEPVGPHGQNDLFLRSNDLRSR
ncbi:hypothetical protein H5410_044063 [Solanum commersonii]|uniref:Uncharacterized protein n=1 Tax=Solanum commersonii TaxID=4109 RepID=A0A9J5Y035_SOLCO|nr:hypothetical protein H5410_044063 [Solanum commersonii]